MSQPITITNKTTLQQELMAVASSLNMYIAESAAEFNTIQFNTYISALPMGNHAYKHLTNIMRFLSDPNIEIVVKETHEHTRTSTHQQV